MEAQTHRAEYELHLAEYNAAHPQKKTTVVRGILGSQVMMGQFIHAILPLLLLLLGPLVGIVLWIINHQ